MLRSQSRRAARHHLEVLPKARRGQIRWIVRAFGRSWVASCPSPRAWAGVCPQPSVDRFEQCGHADDVQDARQDCRSGRQVASTTATPVSAQKPTRCWNRVRRLGNLWGANCAPVWCSISRVSSRCATTKVSWRGRVLRGPLRPFSGRGHWSLPVSRVLAAASPQRLGLSGFELAYDTFGLLRARYRAQKVSRLIDFSSECPACHAGAKMVTGLLPGGGLVEDQRTKPI